MSQPAIRVENIGKQYHIARQRKKYTTLRESVTTTLTTPFRRAGKLLRGHVTGAADLDDVIWALRNLSFQIDHGEVVGIIGRNGAGKSTLLKILSRITEPTEGCAMIHGRVGSLLEVGTGFHFELTGRENLFLNGAILGMKRSEIISKFDEIVAFAELEKFIDTPVKHYSTGMYMRLAFAVAAHLDPEIMIVDEVLAVGDARFQRKCMNKMQDVGKQGRTVLFVSHNMPAITRLCQRTILLEQGRVLKDGPSHHVVSAYMTSGVGTTAVREWADPARAPAGKVVRLRAVRVRAERGQVADVVDIREPVGIEMEYEVLLPGHKLLPFYHFHNDEGIRIFSAHDLDPQWRQRPRSPGRYISTAWIPGNLLSEGIIFVASGALTTDPVRHQFLVREVVAFQVVDSLEGDTARGDWGGNIAGVVRPRLQWKTKFTPNSDHP